MLRLLGRVRWETTGGLLDLGTVKQRTVLVALAVDAGRLVTWSELVDRVWDQAPPTGARRVLYTCANRIRRLLETLNVAGGGPPARLVRRSGGYLLQLDPEQVDLHRFHRLVAAAGDRQRSYAEWARLPAEALDLWPASPLADLPGDWPTRVRQSLGPQRLDAGSAFVAAGLSRVSSPDDGGRLRGASDAFVAI